MNENLLTTSQSQRKYLMLIFEGTGEEMVKLWSEHEKNPNKVLVSFGLKEELDFDQIKDTYEAGKGP